MIFDSTEIVSILMFLCFLPSRSIIQTITGVRVCLKLENEINLGPQAVTTDVEKNVHLLMDCYNDGFTLAKFVRVPDIHVSTDVTNWISDQPYQAILTKERVDGYVIIN